MSLHVYRHHIMKAAPPKPPEAAPSTWNQVFKCQEPERTFPTQTVMVTILLEKPVSLKLLLPGSPQDLHASTSPIEPSATAIWPAAVSMAEGGSRAPLFCNKSRSYCPGSVFVASSGDLEASDRSHLNLFPRVATRSPGSAGGSFQNDTCTVSECL